MGQVVAEKLFGTYKQTENHRMTLQKNPTYPNFPFRDVSLTRTHLSTGRLTEIGTIKDMRFEGLSIGKWHVKNLQNRARFGRLMVCRKNTNFQDFRP